MATPLELLNLRTILIPQVFPGGQAFSPEEEDFRRNLQDIINNIITLINIGTTDGSIGAGFDGVGSVIESGAEVDVICPYDGTITGNTIVASETGSLVIDVKKCAYDAFPTFTSIVSATPPTLSSADKSQDTTLTGWTLTVTAGDIFRFFVTSATTVTRATVSLAVTKGPSETS